jgi:hypothetical protein
MWRSELRRGPCYFGTLFCFWAPVWPVIWRSELRGSPCYFGTLLMCCICMSGHLFLLRHQCYRHYRTAAWHAYVLCREQYQAEFLGTCHRNTKCLSEEGWTFADCFRQSVICHNVAHYHDLYFSRCCGTNMAIFCCDLMVGKGMPGAERCTDNFERWK